MAAAAEELLLLAMAMELRGEEAEDEDEEDEDEEEEGRWFSSLAPMVLLLQWRSADCRD
jgi:hypothetical protein